MSVLEIMLKLPKTGRQKEGAICYSTLRRVIKEDQGKSPYHIQTKHMLSADDKRRRQVMARALLPIIETKPLFFEWAPHSPDLSPPDFFLWVI